MRRKKRWDPCVSHRGREVRTFFREYFAERERTVVVVAGAGFDPRASLVISAVCEATRNVRALLLREERPNASEDLVARAEENVKTLLRHVPDAKVVHVPIFTRDGAVIGWKGAVEAVMALGLERVTDVVVDFSALSVGVAYPIARCLLERCDKVGNFNLHLMVADLPAIDAGIRAHASDKAETLQGFDGGLGSEDKSDAATLWVPQLREDRSAVLTRIFDEVEPDDVCPVLPFPSEDPTAGDRLIEHYADLFESTWRVQSHDIIYADQHDPLDLYRAILEIDNVRSRVFDQIGGSLTVLSPLGSKVLSIGTLMAAVERDFPVVYVEAASYTLDGGGDVRPLDPDALLHVWLAGDAYAGLKKEGL